MKQLLLYITILQLFVICPSVLNAQRPQNKSLFSGTKQTGNNNSTQNVVVVKRNASMALKSEEQVQENDSCAYYLNITRRNGWFVGVGRNLTEKEIDKVTSYFKLSQINEYGHFTHVEAYDATNHPKCLAELFSNQLTIDTDKEGRSSDWQNLLQTITQLKINGNSEYAKMISAYDSGGNLIFVYMQEYNNEGYFIGHFTDSFGEPISLDDENKQRMFVYLTLDGNGYEKEIRQMQENLYYVANTNGAYATIFENNPDGTVKRAMSCDINGVPIIDKWGNCGYDAVYDEWGQIKYKRYFGDSYETKRLSSSMSEDDVMEILYSYDSYHRLLQKSFCKNEETSDSNGRKTPDTNQSGVHYYKYAYNELGELILIESYGKTGELVNNVNSYARVVYDIEDGGKKRTVTYYDKDGKFVNNEDKLCRNVKIYNTRNEIVEEFRFRGNYGHSTPSDTVLVYHSLKTPNSYNEFFHDNDSLIYNLQTTFNSKGEEIVYAFYDITGKPFFMKSLGFHRRETSCVSKNGIDTKEVLYYDENMSLAKVDSILEYNRIVYELDYNKKEEVVSQYNNRELLKRYGQIFSDQALQEVSGQFGFDVTGDRARTHLEDAYYYTVISSTTYHGRMDYMAGRNEFDEPSYVLEGEASSSVLYCIKQYSTSKDKFIYYDENYIEIPSDTRRKELRDSLYKVICIEVVDQKAKALGIKSGDLIIRYGDFYYPKSSIDRWKYMDWLHSETFIKADECKKMLVLRYDKNKKGFKVVEINLPTGTPYELGFNYMLNMCTDRERLRFDNAVSDYLQAKKIDKESFCTDEAHFGGRLVYLMRPYKISNTKFDNYVEGFRGDAIILAVKGKDSNGNEMKGSLLEGYSSINGTIKKVSEKENVIYYYTLDGKTVNTISLKKGNGACYTSSEFVDQNTYNKLKNLSEEIKGLK